jgi:hypothetical protein
LNSELGTSATHHDQGKEKEEDLAVEYLTKWIYVMFVDGVF